ncbi:MAG: hypothetical protein FWG22_03125 [Prolixibacteraceae bacterium]|nr:hypothetical protein [Prolixibacteraceae bacterium]
MQNPDYIELEKRREFGDIFSVTFQFLKSNFKKFFFSLLVFVLPFAFITGIFTSFYMNSIMSFMENEFDSFTWNAVIYILLMMVGVFVSYAMVCGVVFEFFKLYKRSRDAKLNKTDNDVKTYMKERDAGSYRQGDGKAGDFTIGDVGSELQKDIGRILLCTFVYSALVFVGAIFCILPGIYLSIALFPLLMICLLEERSLGESFSYCFQLIRDNWWNTFLVFFVMSMIVGVISNIFYIPAYIYTVVSMMTGMESGNAGMSQLSGIFMSIYVVVYVLLISIVQIAMVFQYFNLKERKEHSGLMKNIDNLGT